MRTNTAHQITELIQNKGNVSPKELIAKLGISPQAIHKQLKNLQKKNIITKVGSPPNVIYVLKEKSAPTVLPSISQQDQVMLQNNFLIITPHGQLVEGGQAFAQWCSKQKLPFLKTLEEYKKTLQKYDTYKSDTLIDGTKKMLSTFDEVYIDRLYYVDFYSIERFGKTRLGLLMLHGKQSQNTTLIKMVSNEVNPRIRTLIKNDHIDAVCFIPPSVKRGVQFMHELKKNLALSLPTIEIQKLETPIVIQQKSLSKLEDRMENARVTLAIKNPSLQQSYDTILLIDDAVGSGATMNDVSHKLKQSGICKKSVIGLAVTGSVSGFDVIAEV